MIRKPAACQGCPFYGDGGGFVPGELRGSPVLVYGQNPGEAEEAQGKPFVGATGATMERKYFKVAGLSRDDVSLDNAIRCRWKGKNELPPLSQTLTREALRHCYQAHFKLPEATRIIVTQGDYALSGLTGQTSSTDWRGYALALHGQPHLSGVWVPRRGDIAILATVHLARLFRDPTLTLATLSDWAKVPRLLVGKWPKPAPEYLTEPPEEWPVHFAFDTEFTPQNKLIRYSISTGEQTYVVEGDHPTTPRLRLREGGRSRVISQYTPADIRHLGALAGVDPWRAFDIDDTVWKHATLYSDHPHDLNYLGSIYSSMNRWKHLGAVEPQLYAGADAYGTWEVNQALNKEFLRDPLSRRVYEELDRPVLEYFVKAQYAGQRVDKARVKQVMDMLEIDRDEAQARAVATVGWPMKLSSPQQVSHRLYAEEEILKRR